MIAVGELRHRIALQAPARTPDGGGGGAVAYATFDTVWAAVTPVATVSAFLADREERRRRFRVTLRHRDDITFSTRIVYRTLSLEITDIQTIEERGRFLVLGCEETDA